MTEPGKEESPSPIVAYFRRFLGARGKAPPMMTWQGMLWSFITSFTAFLILSLFHYELALDTDDLILMVASFGASTVLIFSAPQAPFAQVG